MMRYVRVKSHPQKQYICDQVPKGIDVDGCQSKAPETRGYVKREQQQSTLEAWDARETQNDPYTGN